MTDMRWLKKNVANTALTGVPVYQHFLQFRTLINPEKHGSKEEDKWTEWKDVPVVDDEK